MTNNSLVFWPGHYIQIKVTFLLNILNLSTKILAIKIEKHIISQKMIKKDLKKNMTDFL